SDNGSGNGNGNGKDKTEEGCIVQQGSDFYLQPKHGKVQRLSSTEDLSAHVGHQVKVHGRESKTGSASTSGSGMAGDSSAYGGENRPTSSQNVGANANPSAQSGGASASGSASTGGVAGQAGATDTTAAAQTQTGTGQPVGP